MNTGTEYDSIDLSKDEYLIKLLDGYLINVETDCERSPGCPTCDYGSRYTTYATFYMDSDSFTVTTNRMYNYAISEGWLIRLIIKNIERIKEMTKKEFKDFISDSVNTKVGSTWGSKSVVVE